MTDRLLNQSGHRRDACPQGKHKTPSSKAAESFPSPHSVTMVLLTWGSRTFGLTLRDEDPEAPVHTY